MEDRPLKRPKLLSPPLQPLPPTHLLLSLPSLLLTPPSTHPNHAQSLHLSLLALRKCLSLNHLLTPDVECRAWTALAEVGIRVVDGGFCDSTWASGVEGEVERAINKGLLIAQTHPSLRLYKHHLSLLHASHAHHTNPKFARSLYKRLLSPSYFIPAQDPPSFIYRAHLDYIECLVSPPRGYVGMEGYVPPKADLIAALAAVETLHDLSVSLAAASSSDETRRGHAHVTLLTHTLRLRLLLSSHPSTWSTPEYEYEYESKIPSALLAAEIAFGVSYDSPLAVPRPALAPIPTPLPITPTPSPTKPSLAPNPLKRKHPTSERDRKTEAETETGAYIHFTHPLERALCIHVLVLAVVYYTALGDSARAGRRLGHLHALMDADAEEGDGDGEGVYEIHFPPLPPLTLALTHPHTALRLVFLLSAGAKRDAVGRRPKRAVFAREGGRVCEAAGVGGEVKVRKWASLGEGRRVGEVEERVRVELISEVVGISILRSEFDVAKENLASLISHTLSTQPPLFPSYAPLIALHHAHLAHAQGDTERAQTCYKVAAYTASSPERNGEGARQPSFVAISARAGALALRLGLAAAEAEGKGKESVAYAADLEEEAKKVALLCRGMGGALEAVGQVVEACLASEILKAKTHLKRALSLASAAQDNHLRALVLALIAAHYVHTAEKHAMEILGTCEQLAAGLGAGAVRGVGESRSGDGMGKTGGGEKDGDKVGNAPLRMWVGERFLEMYKRGGGKWAEKAEKQAKANKELRGAVERVRKGRG